MVDLVSKRKYFFMASIVLLLIGAIGLFVNGLRLDVQFQGGTRIMIETDAADIDITKVKGLVEKEIGKEVTAQMMQTYNASDKSKKINMLRLDIANPDQALTDVEREKVINVIKNNFAIKEAANIDMLSVEPSIGAEMLRSGLMAAFLASILIVLYVAWRFSVMSGLSAALMAIVALMHDAAMMFSVYTVFKIPINEVFIAAVLTILGYSMNDTIIIYDRIRENSRLMRKATLPEIVNTSIIQTMARSINTTLTVLVCVITLYIFASVNNISSLKEFSLPLIVGLTSGAYSSIFIASPLWMMWRQNQLKR